MIGTGTHILSPLVFRELKPPPGYIPGIGRGAVGFLTRSDVGPAKANPELGAAAGIATTTAPGGRGRGTTTTSTTVNGSVPGYNATAEKEESTGGTGGDEVFDSFSGYSEQLFTDAPYEADDAAADAIYASVEERLAARNKRRRAQEEEQARKKARIETTRIADTFVDVKRDLANVSYDEWNALPELSGDRSLKFKKKDEEYTPVPDSILKMGASRNLTSSTIETRTDENTSGNNTSNGNKTSGSTSTLLTDISGFSAARGQVLSMKLDRLSDSVSGQTVVDPQGYLTSMAGTASSGATPLAVGGGVADVADIKKARLLMKSIITTNPNHGPGWIAAARLEESVGDLPAARSLIRSGCESCPDDEDIWLEATRLAAPGHGRTVLASAVARLPNSVKLWLAAADLETALEGRRAVLRKALTLIPGSERLWKAAVSLEPKSEDARLMLTRAVECVPTSLDLWLALARLEDHVGAQKVLNAARIALPAEPAIWVAAARLEESVGRTDLVEKIIGRALRSLASQQAAVVGDRENWLKLAEEAESNGAPATAAAIVTATASVGVDDVDRRRTWSADAEALSSRNSIACARAMHAALLSAFPDRESLWTAAADFERKVLQRAIANVEGDANVVSQARERLDALLLRAVAAVPNAEVLWLMAAKERWLGGNVAGARAILRDAFAANPSSESIWLAAAKLEWETNEVARARALLARARSAAPGPRVIVKSATLERDVGDNAAEENLLRAGVASFPTAPKLWMMLGQLYERLDAPARAAEAYATGTRTCPSSIPLWILAASLAERDSLGGGVARARNILDAGRLANPKSAPLFLAGVRLERRAGQERAAEALLARGLQETTGTNGLGLLLAEDILTAPRAAQRRKSAAALKATSDNDPHVILAVARLFISARKFDKARKWLHRAITLDPDFGDAWIWAAALEEADTSANPTALTELEHRCATAEPAHGEFWQEVSKSPEGRRCDKIGVLRLALKKLKEKEKACGLWDVDGKAILAKDKDEENEL